MKRKKKEQTDPRQLILSFPFPDSWCTPVIVSNPGFKGPGFPSHPFKWRKDK